MARLLLGTLQKLVLDVVEKEEDEERDWYADHRDAQEYIERRLLQPISLSAIRTVFARLTHQKLVVSSWRAPYSFEYLGKKQRTRRRKIYKITDAGKAALREFERVF